MHFFVSARPKCQEWMNMKRYLWILALPLLGAAQVAPPDVAAPTLGYLWEETTRSLHSIDGVPGAASLGRPVHLGTSLSRIDIAPGRRFAIGQQDGSPNLMLVRLDGAIGSASRSELAAGVVFFSPSAETVAVIADGRVDVWNDVQSQARRSRSFAADAKFDRLYVSDDGHQVLALSEGRLYRLNEGNTELIGDGFRDLAFLKRSHDVIALHAARGVVLLRKAEAGAEESLAAVETPLALALSADEQRIAVLRGESVVLFDRLTRQAVEITLDGVAAGGLVRAEGNAVFQLTAASADGIWFLDADSASPRMVAVNKGEMQ